METNFFQAVASLQVAGGWTINLAMENADRWVVSVLLYNEQVGDEAAKRIPPLVLRGTAQALDAGFFAAIGKPAQQTAQLLVNMQHFLQEREKAKINSQMEKDKSAKAERAKMDKDKKYEDAIKKADELEAEGKYREAWMKLPEPTDYPEYDELLRERKTALAKKFAPDLFND